MGMGAMSRQWVAGASLNKAYEMSKLDQLTTIKQEKVRLARNEAVACLNTPLTLCKLQYGQVASDAWKKKGVNGDQKMINICLNLPSGKSVFTAGHATKGDEGIRAPYLKSVMLEGAKQVHIIKSGVLILSRC